MTTHWTFWTCPGCGEEFSRFTLYGVDMEIDSLRDLNFEATKVEGEWQVTLDPSSAWAMAPSLTGMPMPQIEQQCVLAKEYMENSEYEDTPCCSMAFEANPHLLDPPESEGEKFQREFFEAMDEGYPI